MVLAAARDELAKRGYDGLSVATVAQAAGTTRPAIYRRWKTKAELAVAAVADMSVAHLRPDTSDPRADLVAELAAFRIGVMRPNGLGTIGAMLQRTTDPALVEAFRERIVMPRRARIRSILERAVVAGLLSPDADIELAVAASTGTIYALALANEPIDDAWAERAAAFVWLGAGGDPA